MRKQAFQVTEPTSSAFVFFLLLTQFQIPITKDVCIFCVARLQFASVHALRRPQRRLLSSTRALYRPLVTQVAQKEDEGAQESDSEWGHRPSRPFGGGWSRARTVERDDLTPEEVALKNSLQKDSPRGSSTPKVTSPKPGQSETIQGPRVSAQASPRTRQLRETPIYHKSLNLPDDRFNDHAPVEKSQVSSSIGSLQEKSGPGMLADREITVPLPPSRSHAPRKPSNWTKSDRTMDLDSDDMVLKQNLRKAATPKPHPPFYQSSHSPRTSSVPGHPSMPELQKKDARSEEIAQTSPDQTPSTQRQRTHGSTDQPWASEYRQGWDARPDRHIGISRKASLFSPIDWVCPSCTIPNSRRRQVCRACHTENPFMKGSATIPEVQPEDVKRWKHVRRLGSDVSPDHSQPETVSTQGHSDDTQAEEFARARAIEQAKTERMERTKGGEFVGLRNQYETATSRAMKASYWSQTPQVEPTFSSTPEKSESGIEMQGFRGKRFVRAKLDSNVEDRPTTGGVRRWQPFSAGVQSRLEEPSHHGPSDQINGSTQRSSIGLKHRQNVRDLDEPIVERDSRSKRQPLEQVLYDQPVSYFRGNDRHRMRKRKEVVPTWDDMDEDDQDRANRRMERKERKKAKALKKSMAAPTPIYLPEFISVSNLAGVLKVRVEDFIHKMRDLGFGETKTDLVLDAETAGLVAAEFNFEPIFEQAENPDLLPRPPAEDKSTLPPRPPVITIMGHVDHGKTTLLDYLRKSSVAASEHGGITQHIGAFSVPMPGGRLVTFLDTPGHEAFLSMRQRGANVTDIVILVVAADDSVKPQTIEAIKHAQTARVPMIVAVNKIDKEDADAERVKRDLARYGVEVEDYGGDTQAVCVSGKTGQGMRELEDATVALADILDMRSETDGQAEGWVLEATTKKAGRVATVLVRRGTLRPGDIIVAGTSWARVRSLRNEAGVMLKSAGPGTPVEIDGWREQLSAGDEVLQAPDEQRAKAAVDYRLEAHERAQMATDMAAVNEARRLEQEKREELEKAKELAEDASDAAAATGEEGQSTSSTPSFQEVFFIVKADVSGSVEAVTNAVSALGNSEVYPNILRTGVGPVTEFDIDHAAVAKGHIISFNTTADSNIQRMAEAKEVTIINQSIIYRLVDAVKAKLSERLPVVVTQKVLGEAEIAQIFKINTKGRVTVPVAGCRVKNGVVGRNNKVRVLREKETIYDGILLLHHACGINFIYHTDLIEGTLSSLKNVKKDVTEMRKGTECGMSFENWTDFEQGDQVQCYEETSEKRAL